MNLRSHQKDCISEETELQDYSTNTSQRLANLFIKSDMCDVCLVVDGKNFNCHRLILSAASDVFKALLNTRDFIETGSDRITLVEPANCSKIFPLFLEYLYSGNVTCSLSNVMPFYLLSDKYAVIDLMSHCQDFMSENMALAAKSGYLLRWMDNNALAANSELSQKFQDFLSWNVSLLTLYQGIYTLTESILIPLLSRSDIVIHDELALYRLAETWLQNQLAKNSSKKSKNLLHRVISKIRFSMMTYDQSADMAAVPLAQKHSDTFMPLMGVSVNFHNGDFKKLREYFSTRAPELWQFEPRLYTMDATSSVMTVERVRALRDFHVTTYLFSTDISLARHEGARNCEWIVDLYPKGVKILGCYLITFRGKLELPGTIKNIVRMAITCKDPEPFMPVVKISVLCYGNQGGVEYVRSVTQRCHKFDQNDRVLHLDGFIPHIGADSDPFLPYLVGPDNDTLKLQVVITPMPNLLFVY